MTSKAPNLFLTPPQYLQLFPNQTWTTKDVCLQDLSELPSWLSNRDTIAVYASGSCDRPRLENGEVVVGGFERARHETKPVKGESDVNVDAFFVAEPNVSKYGCSDYPVYGRSKKASGRAGHWPTLNEFVTAYALDGSHPDDR